MTARKPTRQQAKAVLGEVAIRAVQIQLDKGAGGPYYGDKTIRMRFEDGVLVQVVTGDDETHVMPKMHT